ncbi:unnamed protein product [Ectocarpus sp. 12 AP-2014]
MPAVVGTAPALPINPADWSYLAEGGFHIILRYDGEDPVLSGRILRIGKKALGHQKEEGGKEPAVPAAAVVVPDETGARRKFERGVLIPLLGEQYVQPGDAVTLSREDIGKIHLSIDHLRPEGRIKKDNGDWSSACQLEPDKTAFWLKLPSAPSTAGQASPTEDRKKKGVVIAVEIKPKGATMPVGTLVPPGNNRLKYRVARFDAQQRFKAQGKQSWGSIDRPCLYHPRELYSGDADRAAATLKELMKTPQNKLRAWENGNMLFGAGSGKGGEDVTESGETAGEVALGKAVVTAGLAGGEGTPAEALIDLVGEILAMEPLVSRLVAAQALDVLEVEGGGLVFDKLVSLCGGSKEEALNILEAQESDPFVAEPIDKDLIVPEATLEALRAGSPVVAGEASSIDTLHAKGLLAVEKLGVKDCVQLLRRYIIALGVMDCSVMMSLKSIPAAPEGGSGGEGQPSAVQGKDVAGVFQTGGGRRVAYCVSVVDAGPKPPTKLSGKAKHEAEIWDFVAGLEETGQGI